MSRRTATEEAYADAKIREETRMTHHLYDSEVGHSMFGEKETVIEIPTSNIQSVSRRNTNEATTKASNKLETLVDSSKQIHEFINSRPETASFNQ